MSLEQEFQKYLSHTPLKHGILDYTKHKQVQVNKIGKTNHMVYADS